MTPRGRLDEAYFRDLMKGCGWLLFWGVGTVVIVAAIIVVARS